MQRIQSPRVDDDAVEQEIRDKGLTAARVTPADIEANIACEYYFTGDQGLVGALIAWDQQVFEDAIKAGSPLSLLTFCVLQLRNGFTVTGESACASPENFNGQLGRKIARQNAVNKPWPLMGYALKQALHEAAAG